ncbi:Gfo/Idh/MocA family protein [Mangrovicoccus sp. HB161399]|uniref:Gfo/Idh/MocA family protein n=1 Tax=Mangrovicoccus sp. HB161399 TaxID=2720392 RepID=UPI0015545DC3|nr:Gfo/Idh/MocA family oxidoreductase [Mangrovicoccus sp. HB161399]
MTATPMRTGVIGLNPGRHWAAAALQPALAVACEIVGVANRTPESAQRTAQAPGLYHAFASPAELAASSEIGLVVVAVKVPRHLEPVALEAGKHVHCEWPLGNRLAEARQLARLAEENGAVAVSGTQARTPPEILHLEKLVAEDNVGSVLSTSLIGSGGNWAGTTSAELCYLFDTSNGETMQDIPTGHARASVQNVLDGFGPAGARSLSDFDTVTVIETGEDRPKTAADQVLVQGAMDSGAAFSLHYRGGTGRGTNFLWEIDGTGADLQATAGLGHEQLAQLSIRGARGGESEMTPQMPEASAHGGRPDFAGARNIAGMYALMAGDIRTGSRSAPSFADAVKLHELLDRIGRSPPPRAVPARSGSPGLETRDAPREHGAPPRHDTRREPSSP